MIRSKHFIFSFAVVMLAIFMTGLLLVACGTTSPEPTATSAPTVMPIMITLTPTFATPTATIFATASSLPALSPSPRPTINVAMTPDAVQIERWKEYEFALAKAVFNLDHPEYVLCEWVILGQSKQEVYVWVVCQDQHGWGSLPAVIYLRKDGSVRDTKTTHDIPGPYSDAIRKLFPENIRENFNYYHSGGMEELLNHIQLRREHPEEPPLIVQSVTPMP